MAYKLTEKELQNLEEGRQHNRKLCRESSIYKALEGYPVQDKVEVLKKIVQDFRDKNTLCKTCGAIYAIEKREVKESHI